MFSNPPSASPVTRRRLTSAPYVSSCPMQYGSERSALRRCQSPRKPDVKVTSDKDTGRNTEAAEDVGSTGPGVVIEPPSALQGARGETAYVVPLQDEENHDARQCGRRHARL